jgi:homogentisate 1,2-dioxygenase
MPFYHRMGTIPHKRHTQFRKPNGQLYAEQLMGTKGFSGVQSLLYHHRAPTNVKEVLWSKEVTNSIEINIPLQHRHFKTFQAKSGGDPITARRMLLANNDIAIGIATPDAQMDYFYRNGEGDELLFVHEGRGRLQTVFGTLSYGPGDYLVIPIGTTYRISPDDQSTRFLVIETKSGVFAPKRYRNEHGQLLENSPYCERDIRPPDSLETCDQLGDFEIRVRAHGKLTSYLLGHHPFDVVGWDGYLFPYALNIADFEPITGRIHQPPPVHQTFEGHNFVVCSFVPRKYDYHPQAVPAPYNHSNVDSDELLYYVDGNFMSRKGIERGSITLHPAGIPHGPHPGTVEASLGKEETLELAVMVDTFKPLYITDEAGAIEDTQYMQSWRLP